MVQPADPGRDGDRRLREDRRNAAVEYDVRPIVSGNGTYTFVLVGTSDDGVDFGSRENGTSSKRPRLVLTLG